VTSSPATPEALRGRYPVELEHAWQPSGSPPLLLRPLRALVELAARDAANHAAGRPPEPRGTLARQAQMFKVVALGR